MIQIRDTRTEFVRHLARLTSLSEVLTLGSLLRCEFVGKASLSLDCTSDRVTVLGSLNLSYDQVSTRASSACEIRIERFWRTQLPKVFCRAPWRREVLPQKGNAEWHVNPDGSLCYELPERWQCTLAHAEAQLGPDTAGRLAAAWCLGSVRWLLYHHLEAYRVNLQTWPAEWPAWGHYERGPAEYAKLLAEEKTQRKQKVKSPPKGR